MRTTVARPVQIVPKVLQKRAVVRRPQKHAVLVEAAVADVPPFRVDVPIGLGVDARSLRNDSIALLAGVALLIAAAVGASAAGLTLVAARSTRSAP